MKTKLALAGVGMAVAVVLGMGPIAGEAQAGQKQSKGWVTTYSYSPGRVVTTSTWVPNPVVYVRPSTTVVYTPVRVRPVYTTQRVYFTTQRVYYTAPRVYYVQAQRPVYTVYFR